MPLKQSQGFWISIAIAGFGVSLIGLGLALGGRRSYDPVASAELIPETAIMAGFISPNPQALNQLQQFGNTQTRRLITRNFNQIKQHSLESPQLNFDRDIQPWINGVMVALLPTAEEFDLLMVVGIKDPLRAWLFRRKFHQQPGIQYIERDYRNVKITEYIESEGKRYHVAVLQGHVVLGASHQPVEKAIDTFLGEPTLAESNPMVQRFLNGAELAFPLGAIWLSDSPAVIEQLTDTVTTQTQQWLSLLVQLQSLESTVFAVGVEPEGLRVKWVNQFDAEKMTIDATKQLSPIVSRFPTQTVALVQGKSINQIWFQLLQLAQDHQIAAQWVQQIRQALQTINLDADQDVIGWMDGEFALAAIASDEGILAPFGLGGVLFLETSNSIQANQMLDQLDNVIANSNPPVNIEQRWIENVEVTEWRDPNLGALFGHGWLNERLLFIAFGEPVVEAIATLPQSPLPDNPQFQSITQALPQANVSYVYLDMNQLTSWMTGYLLAAPATALQPNLLTLLNSVEGMGLSLVYSEDSRVEVELLFVLESTLN